MNSNAIAPSPASQFAVKSRCDFSWFAPADNLRARETRTWADLCSPKNSRLCALDSSDHSPKHSQHGLTPATQRRQAGRPPHLTGERPVPPEILRVAQRFCELVAQ